MAITSQDIKKFIGGDRPLDKQDLTFMAQFGRPLADSEKRYISMYDDGLQRIIDDANKNPMRPNIEGIDVKIMGRYFSAGNSMADLEKAAQNGDATAKKWLAAQGEMQKWEETLGAVKSYAKTALEKGLTSITSSDFAENKIGKVTVASSESSSSGTSVKDFSKLSGQELFMQIYNGELTPSKDNALWTSLYENGQPIAAQQEAYSKWSNFMAENPSYRPPIRPQVNAPAAKPFPEKTPTGLPGSSATPTNRTSNTGNADALAALENDPAFQSLPEGLKALYKQIVESWDPATELNPDTVLKAFNDVQTSTIDPYYQGLANMAIKEIETAKSNYLTMRSIELENEGMNAEEAIRQTKKEMAAKGMTFTGEGIRQLGKESAYAQEGTAQAAASTIPTQTKAANGTFLEGIVPKSNRLIASSSEARYQENQQNLGISAEKTLGSEKAKTLVPGYTPASGVEGTLETNKQQDYGSVLNGLIANWQRNITAKNPVNY